MCLGELGVAPFQKLPHDLGGPHFKTCGELKLKALVMEALEFRVLLWIRRRVRFKGRADCWTLLREVFGKSLRWDMPIQVFGGWGLVLPITKAPNAEVFDC